MRWARPPSVNAWKKRAGNRSKTLRDENVPADADIVVTHASLEGRVKRVTDKPLILINNYIGDPKLDTLFNQLTAEHKH